MHEKEMKERKFLINFITKYEQYKIAKQSKESQQY